ncbi:MAG: redoxin family protein [Actinomycetota bacterium]|nr:redoxin family protein [Actinomycetota bacterium]
MSLWLLSYFVLWIVVGTLAVAVVVLFRQLGVLHLRFGPRGALALSEGPPVGEPAPRIATTDLTGALHELGGGGTATTVVFISPDCPLCDSLVPAIRALHGELGTDEDLIAVTSDDDDASRAYQRRLGAVPLVASSAIGEAYGITGTPYAVHIDAQGIVARKGVVNTLEQLEGVVEPSRLYAGA